MKKKSQIAQAMTLFIIILVLAVTVVIGKVILNSFYSEMNVMVGNSTLTPAQKAQHTAMQTNVETSYLTFDYAIAAIAILFIIGGVITSFLIPSHPIFLVINIIGIFILVFLGMIMTNVYGELVSGEGATYLGDSADNFPLVNYLMQYLPYIGAVMVAICSIVMYARGM